MKHPHLAEGQSVNFVDPSGKTQKGQITKVMHADAAEIELSKSSTAIAEFSDKKEPGTFHFPAESAQPAVQENKK